MFKFLTANNIIVQNVSLCHGYEAHLLKSLTLILHPPIDLQEGSSDNSSRGT